VTVEHDTPQGSLDVAEQTMFDRIPFGGVRRVVGDTQGQSQARAEPDEVLLEAERAHGIGSAGIERQDDFPALCSKRT
jgi:hypothetical protein